MRLCSDDRSIRLWGSSGLRGAIDDPMALICLLAYLVVCGDMCTEMCGVVKDLMYYSTPLRLNSNVAFGRTKSSE